ncbi:MAG: T9SS type A sorting domain-containing protein [Chitinophagales bacterium]
MKKNICAFLCSSFLFIASIGQCQTPYAFSYDFGKADYLSDALYTSDGNLLVTGYSLNDMPGYFIAKFDLLGDTIWFHEYQKPNPNGLTHVTGNLLETENGYFLCGYIHKKGLIRKFSKEGVSLWDKAFELNTDNLPRVKLTLIEESSQHKILASGSSGAGAGGYSFVYLMMDSDGTNEHLIWGGQQKTQAPVSLIPMHDGGAFLITYAGANYYPPNDVFPEAYRMNAAGNLLWYKKMVLPFNARPTACIRTNDDHLLMIGGGLDSVFIMMMDTFCNPVWIETAALRGVSGEISMNALSETSAGNFLVSGSVRGDPYNDFCHPLLLEINANGDLLWAKKMSMIETISARLFKILPLATNQIIWCGIGRIGTYYSPLEQNIYLLSSDTTGSLSCASVDTTVIFHSSALLYLIDEVPNTLSYNYSLIADTVIKIPHPALSTGCPSELELPDNIAQPSLHKISIYPNPAIDVIRFTQFTDPQSELKIFNSYGRLVSNLAFPSASLTIDVAGWTPGIYLYQVEGNQGFQNGKFEIIR